MASGPNGVIVVPYHPEDSRLIQYLEEDHPLGISPYGNGSKFLEDIRNWILDGALKN
jgi:hypothetical protein